MGYNVIHATNYLAEVMAKNIDPSKLENTIITLSSSELSRARGGTHCMSCPVLREAQG